MPHKTDSSYDAEISHEVAGGSEDEGSRPTKRKVFSHSGDLGDIIYFLPVMRAMGGGTLKITAVKPASVPTRQNLLENDAWQALRELLESQGYVDAVEPSSIHDADVDGDAYREPFHTALRENYEEAKEVSLVTWQAWAHGVDPACQNKCWLAIEPNRIARYVFNRTSRYTNPDFAWAAVYDALGKEAVFLGTSDEHQEFVRAVGYVLHVETANLMQAARIIRGSEYFVGNQSCLYAIAEGMKHNALLEVWLDNPNCLFQRENVFHGYDHQTTLYAIRMMEEGQVSGRYNHCVVVRSAPVPAIPPGHGRRR
jgi:hypothetical protein